MNKTWSLKVFDWNVWKRKYISLIWAPQDCVIQYFICTAWNMIDELPLKWTWPLQIPPLKRGIQLWFPFILCIAGHKDLQIDIYGHYILAFRINIWLVCDYVQSQVTGNFTWSNYFSLPDAKSILNKNS